MNGRERPTTPTLSDLSSDGPSTSAAPASLSEAQLFRGYHADVEMRPCACGEPVYADPLCPMPDVSEHNQSTAHQRWRDARSRE